VLHLLVGQPSFRYTLCCIEHQPYLATPISARLTPLWVPARIESLDLSIWPFFYLHTPGNLLGMPSYETKLLPQPYSPGNSILPPSQSLLSAFLLESGQVITCFTSQKLTSELVQNGLICRNRKSPARDSRQERLCYWRHRYWIVKNVSNRGFRMISQMMSKRLLQYLPLFLHQPLYPCFQVRSCVV
jgi:hypothetical protein